MKILEWIFRQINWLFTPEDFFGNWKGHVANQVAHVFIGFALTCHFGIFIALAACVSWEIAHLLRKGKLSDGFEDYSFVSAGAISASTWPFAWVLFLPVLVSGALLRHEQEKRLKLDK